MPSYHIASNICQALARRIMHRALNPGFLSPRVIEFIVRDLDFKGCRVRGLGLRGKRYPAGPASPATELAAARLVAHSRAEQPRRDAPRHQRGFNQQRAGPAHGVHQLGSGRRYSPCRRMQCNSRNEDSKCVPMTGRVEDIFIRLTFQVERSKPCDETPI